MSKSRFGVLILLLIGLALSHVRHNDAIAYYVLSAAYVVVSVSNAFFGWLQTREQKSAAFVGIHRLLVNDRLLGLPSLLPMPFIGFALPFSKLSDPKILSTRLAARPGTFVGIASLIRH